MYVKLLNCAEKCISQIYRIFAPRFLSGINFILCGLLLHGKYYVIELEISLS